MLDVDDFLNRYGDEIVFKFLEAHPAFNVSIGDPAGINKEGEPDKQNLAHRASGRVAILTVKEQEGFYEQITSTYESEIDYLKDDIHEVRQSNDKVRKSLFARHAELAKKYIELHERMQIIEQLLFDLKFFLEETLIERGSYNNLIEKIQWNHKFYSYGYTTFEVNRFRMFAPCI